MQRRLRRRARDTPLAASCVRLLPTSLVSTHEVPHGEPLKRRPNMKKISLGVSAALLVIAGGGCEKPYHQQEERYVLVAANTNLPYWQEAAAGLTDIGKQMGVKVDLVGPGGFAPNDELSA